MFGSDDDRDGEDEWRYSLEDLEDDDAETGDGGTVTADGDREGSGAGVAGSFAPSETIEPGDVDLENAAFVLLGVLLAVAATANYVLMVL